MWHQSLYTEQILKTYKQKDLVMNCACLSIFVYILSAAFVSHDLCSTRGSWPDTLSVHLTSMTYYPTSEKSHLTLAKLLYIT
jgi:hypothetical protein